jgi:hypothetical protein
MSQLRYLYNVLWCRWYRAKCDLQDWVAHHAPLIPTIQPEPPDAACASCGKFINHICAHNTGDGWVFYWQCDDGCGEWDGYIEDWYPFWFGAWCKGKDLERLGIEVM